MAFKDKESRKIWRLKNKEKINEKGREYYHNIHKHKEAFKEYGNIHRRKLKTRYLKSIRSAKVRNLEFTLSLDEYDLEINKPCYYCDNLLSDKSVAGIGLDRIDNSKGYIINNICSCCRTCNRIKGDDLSQTEAVLAIKTILEYRKNNVET